MRIRYTTTVSGPAGVFREGDEADVAADRGKLLIQQGAAVKVEDPPKKAAVEVDEAAGESDALETAEAPNEAEASDPPAAQRAGRPAARGRG